MSSNESSEAKKCLATSVHGSLEKFESGVRGFKSTWIRYTCVGTCEMSRIAAAVVNATCPDVREGYLDECGSDEVFCCDVPLFFCCRHRWRFVHGVGLFFVA